MNGLKNMRINSHENILTNLLPYLGQLGLREAGLAHLGGLAHGDVALSQRPLGEGLGGPVLAGLAVGSVTLTGTLVCRSSGPLPPAAARLALHSSANLRGG